MFGWSRRSAVALVDRVDPVVEAPPRWEPTGLDDTPREAEVPPAAAVAAACAEAWTTDGTSAALAPVLGRLERALGGMALDLAVTQLPSAWSHDGLLVGAIARSGDALERDEVLDLVVARGLDALGGPMVAVVHGWLARITVDEARALLERHPEARGDRLAGMFPAAVRQVLARDGAGDGPVGDVLGDLSPDDVWQGNIGDCWFLSVLGSWAHLDAAAVRSAVRPAPGGWEVRLFVPEVAGSPRLVPVWIPVDGRDPSGERGSWVTAIEQAAARLFGGYAGLDHTPMSGHDLLTGVPCTNYATDLGRDETWSGLVAALAAGRPVSAGLTEHEHAIAVLEAWEGADGRHVVVRDQAGHLGGTRERQTLTWEDLCARTDEVRF